jgi:hypothetical protein
LPTRFLWENQLKKTGARFKGPIGSEKGPVLNGKRPPGTAAS